MKLLINPKTGITFRKNGTIEINSNTARDLNLENGCYVNIAEYNGEYIIFKSNYGIRLHKVNNTAFKHGFLRGYCKSLCKTISNNATIARYRVSDASMLNDRRIIYIITKKNYATERD